MMQLFDRTTRNLPLSLLGDLLARVTDVGRSLDSDKAMLETSLLEHCHKILDRAGEATGLAHAQHILIRYKGLSDDEKHAFFVDLLNEFGIDRVAVNNAIRAWQLDNNESNGRALHFSSEPKSQDLIRRLNQSRNGTVTLVKMRSDLIGFTRTTPALKDLDRDFAHLFSSWFNRGFLQLQCIDWQTPAAILEKIIAYEAVHEIASWDDLRQRVGAPDRRLYGYFHPALGMEPLIFVEVALTASIPGAIAPILSNARTQLPPEEANTAVFYSISNCQSGLKGISFGNFLIKQVVESLRQEFPNLINFVTLSPIPGLRAWAIRQCDSPDEVTTEQDIDLIKQLESKKQDGSLVEFIKDNDDIRGLVAKYLVVARSPRGGATDPVARFHLGNGACLENIHLSADVSDNGLENSWGCMVNYLYNVNDIERNHEAYANSDEIISSQEINNILKSS